ncbi:MAG: two-component system OmpR family phosphate regulon response regulator OmpR [Rhodospirillaceae bacterium]|nr:MAG: two-component system OmpR family phosphate regulon response regulator OmpR [Rhodospirillaceae bacterium]
MPEALHVLVVDDDARLRELLRRYLVSSGFAVTTAADAGEARQNLGMMEFDLIILDIMMPGEDGLTFARILRRTSEIPILLLTARGEADDRIRGLEGGADDYLPKPFEPRELLLRINNILRRLPRKASDPHTELHFGICLYDVVRGELYRGDQPVRLTSAEAALLKVFAARPGEVLSREDLGHHGGQAINLRTVDVQITRLRKKIEADPSLPRYLQTVRGRGYLLRTD